VANKVGIGVENITKLCTAFTNRNRVLVFLALKRREHTIIIAGDLGMSRAGLQKHLEVLFDAGTIYKTGTGRNTKYHTSLVGEYVLQELSFLGGMLDKQRKLIRLDQTIGVVKQGADLVEMGLPFVKELETNRERLVEEICLVVNPKEEKEEKVTG